MLLFKGKLKFLTFTSLGLIYNIIGVLIITLLYNPVIPYKGMSAGQMYFALYNPDKLLPHSAMWLIFIGFLCLLADHFITIYKIDKLTKKILKILLVFISLYILYGIIRTIIVIIITVAIEL
jgi:hypothetical protein